MNIHDNYGCANSYACCLGFENACFMPFQGDLKAICSPNLRRLDSFDDSLDFYEDGDATEFAN